MALDFGIFLPIGPAKETPTSFISTLEQYAIPMKGHIQSLWMSDHFSWGDMPVHEVWTTLAYLAARLPEYQIGTMVLGQQYRNPALLAKMGATLQILSGGRLLMGLGAGWKEDEYHAYGYEMPYPSAGERVSQLEEAVIIMKRLWYDKDPVSYFGRHYRIVNASCQPKPNPIPPIMIGGAGRKTLRVAAQHSDWWNSTAKNPNEFMDQLRTLYENCAFVGRNPKDIRLTWMGKLAVAPTEKEAHALLDPSHNPQLQGTVEQVVEQIAPYIRLGASYIIFEAFGLEQPAIVNLIIEELLPKIRALVTYQS